MRYGLNWLRRVGGVIAWPFQKLAAAHKRWYEREVKRARNYLEHEARRFGGRIHWED